jgi:hypothetical protein
MSEHLNTSPYELDANGEVRVDFHLASEHVGTVQQGREVAAARQHMEQIQAKEVKLTERDVALGLGQRVLKIRRWKAADLEGLTQNDFDLARGE